MGNVHKIDFIKKIKDLERQYKFTSKQVKELAKRINMDTVTVESKSNGMIQNPDIKTYNEMLKNQQSIIRQLIELNNLVDVDDEDELDKMGA